MPIQIYWKVNHRKIENFQTKNSTIFHISAQNIDCGYSLEPPRRGGSNEYPQFIFLSRNKKNKVYPCKPQFYYIKVGFKGVKIIQACFRDYCKTLNICDIKIWRFEGKSLFADLILTHSYFQMQATAYTFNENWI